VSLAFMGPVTGPYAALGRNLANGARLAIEQSTARGDLPVRVALKVFDTQGDPSQAATVKDQVVADRSVVGLIGPAFSGESMAANPTLDQAGLPLITVASNPDLARRGWRVFHRILANDEVQAAEAARYLARGLGITSAAYVHDNGEYGRGLAVLVRSGAESHGVRSVLFDAIDPRASDYSAAVNKIRAAGPAAVFYGGYYPEAGRLVKQLRDGGVQAVFLSGDGARDEGLVEAAGPVAAEGVEVTCPCADPTVPGRAAAKVFAAEYEKEFGIRPGAFSAEGYDAAGIFLEALRRGHTTRRAILEFLNHRLGTYPGVTKDVAFQADGEVGRGPIYVYAIRRGTITFKGTTAELAPLDTGEDGKGPPPP